MSNTARLMAFVKDRPGQWISAFEFEQFGRLCWRTEISRARRKFKAAHDGTIENRQRHSDGCAKVFAADLEEYAKCDCNGVSEYRYVPEPVSQPSDAADLNVFSLSGDAAVTAMRGR